MPITELAKLTKLQIQCMQAGMLSYSGMRTLHTDALTGHVSHFLTTLGTTANRLHKQVLAGSSKVRWTYPSGPLFRPVRRFRNGHLDGCPMRWHPGNPLREVLA